MSVLGQSPVARMPGTGRFVPRLGCVPGTHRLHHESTRRYIDSVLWPTSFIATERGTPGAFEVSHRGPPEVVGVTGYDFTFHPKDYPALLELLGQEEFERRVCQLDVARELWRRWVDGRNPVKDFST